MFSNLHAWSSVIPLFGYPYFHFMMINWLRKIIFLTQSHLGDKYQKLNPNTDLSTKELFALRHYIIVVQYFVFLKNLTLMRRVTFYLFYFFREKRRERGREGENINVWLPLSAPNWGPGLQPRHVPWLGIEPAAFWFKGRHSIQSHTAQGYFCIFDQVLTTIHTRYSINTCQI